MKATDLPDKMLARMSKAERAKLGPNVMTSDEAMARFVAKSEKELQNKMAQLLDLRGIAYMRQRMDKRATGTVGWPDFTFAIRSHHCAFPIAVEVKYEDGKQSKEQRDCIAKMKRDGWNVYEVRTFQEFHSLLNQIQEIATFNPFTGRNEPCPTSTATP